MEENKVREILGIINELNKHSEAHLSYEIVAGDIRQKLNVVEYVNYLLTKEMPKHSKLTGVGSKTHNDFLNTIDGEKSEHDKLEEQGQQSWIE